MSNSSSQDVAHTRAGENLAQYRETEEELYDAIDTTMDSLRTDTGGGKYGWYYLN